MGKPRLLVTRSGFKRVLSLSMRCLSALTFVCLSVIALFGQAIKDDRDLSKYGSVEYDKNDPDRLDSRRVTISQRYDNDHWVYSRVHPETGGVGRVKEEPPPPLIPVDESACIVIGRVGKVEAFLSNDKHGVYSEFTIKI